MMSPGASVTELAGDQANSRFDRRLLLAVVCATVIYGFVVRLWIVFGRLGRLNSDETIGGLLAARIAEGEPRAFYWAQHYGGTVEAWGMAALFKMLPGDRWMFVAVPIIESMAICALTMALVRARLGRESAWVAGAVVWCYPTAFVWFSTRPMLFYQPTVILGLTLAWLTGRIVAGRRHPAWWMTIGLVAGVGWWTSPQVLFFAVPCLVILVRRVRITPVEGVLALIASLIGAFPWIVANLRSSGASLTPVPGDGHGYLDHVGAQLTHGFPMSLGLRVPFTERWLIESGRWFLGLVAVVVVGWALLRTIRHRRMVWVLTGTLATFPLLHALGPSSQFVGNGRYYSFLAPAIGAVAAGAVSRRRSAAAMLAVMLVITTVGFTKMRHLDVASEDTGPLIATLHGRGIDAVYSSYWLAYKITWESKRQIVASPTEFDRYPAYTTFVRQSARVAYVFWMPFEPDAETSRAALDALAAIGVGSESIDIGGYRAIVVERNVPLGELLSG